MAQLHVRQDTPDQTGSREIPQVSRGTPERKERIRMVVTAYTCHPDECGRPLSSPNFCKTASGYKLSDNDSFTSVAADNSIYKMGTRMVIHHPTKGDIPVTVRDTGGAINGNRLDIFVGRLDQKKAFQWGVQVLEVTVYAK